MIQLESSSQYPITITKQVDFKWIFFVRSYQSWLDSFEYAIQVGIKSTNKSGWTISKSTEDCCVLASKKHVNCVASQSRMSILLTKENRSNGNSGKKLENFSTTIRRTVMYFKAHKKERIQFLNNVFDIIYLRAIFGKIMFLNAITPIRWEHRNVVYIYCQMYFVQSLFFHSMQFRGYIENNLYRSVCS